MNLIRSGTVRELIQEEATAQNAADEMEGLLFNKERRALVRHNLGNVVQTLLSVYCPEQTAAERTARLALGIL